MDVLSAKGSDAWDITGSVGPGHRHAGGSVVNESRCLELSMVI